MATDKQFDVCPEFEEAQHNPYRAMVNAGDAEDFEQGRVRVVPPFQAPDRFFEVISNDVGVDVSPVASTSEASLLDFYVRSDEWQHMPNQERVRQTVRAVINELGIAASAYLFNKQYPGSEE